MVGVTERSNPRWLSGALGNTVFRRLFAAQVVALVGTGLLTVALGLLAYDLAGSRAGAVLGTALAIKMVAYVAVAPLMAAVTDRIPRSALLGGTDVVRGAVALMLPFVDAVWQIYVLVFVLQAASATFTPAFQSVIPSVLVDEDDYTQALSMSRLAYDLESLLSPMLAAALLTVISYHSLFLGTVGGFAASAMLVLSSRLPAMPVTERPARLRDRILAGARIMTATQELRALLALNLAVGAATGLVVVNTVIYVRELLGAPQSGLAVALACYGGGSMIVALTVPRLLRTVSDRPCRPARSSPRPAWPPPLCSSRSARPHRWAGSCWADCGWCWGGDLDDQHALGAAATPQLHHRQPHRGVHRPVLVVARVFPADLSDRRLDGRHGRPGRCRPGTDRGGHTRRSDSPHALAAGQSAP